MLAACGGSKKEAEAEKAAEARLAQLRARTDSMRKARSLAISMKKFEPTVMAKRIRGAAVLTSRPRLLSWRRYSTPVACV